MCVCVFVCVRACVRVCACVRACVRESVFFSFIAYVVVDVIEKQFYLYQDLNRIKLHYSGYVFSRFSSESLAS